MKQALSLLLLTITVMLVSACSTVLDVDFGAYHTSTTTGGDGGCKTCQDLGAQCGIQDDGCGNALDCGETCPANSSCDGIHCTCAPKSCSALGVGCGTTDDGCGGSLDCGNCASGLQCVSNQCKCVAKTCADYNNPQCGTYPTGCSTDTINCGIVCSGQTPNCDDGVCSAKPCTAKKCADLGNPCDTEPDGCGGTVGPCTTCTSPQTCGGGGTPHQCGCTAETCAEVGNPCDAVANGCGGNVGPCVTCTSPQTCGGGGVAHQCGCKPTGKCPGGADCGTVPNGCGGFVSCGGVCSIDFACEANVCTYIGGGGCFPGSSLVLMADGSQRPIETVHVGDAVMTYDTDAHSFVADTVASFDAHPDASRDGLLVINGTLHVTPNHPLYTGRGSLRADQLQLGDELTTTRGVQRVTSIGMESGNKPVFTIAPRVHKTFIVNGVVVLIKA